MVNRTLRAVGWTNRSRYDPADFAQIMYDRARAIMGDSDFMSDSIEQVRTSDAVAYTLLDTVMVPYPWFRGRVMIMGDAAHSMTPYLGSGAAMAIEDGVVFAQLLETHQQRRIRFDDLFEKPVLFQEIRIFNHFVDP